MIEEMLEEEEHQVMVRRLQKLKETIQNRHYSENCFNIYKNETYLLLCNRPEKWISLGTQKYATQEPVHDIITGQDYHEDGPILDKIWSLVTMSWSYFGNIDRVVTKMVSNFKEYMEDLKKNNKCNPKTFPDSEIREDMQLLYWSRQDFSGSLSVVPMSSAQYRTIFRNVFYKYGLYSFQS